MIGPSVYTSKVTPCASELVDRGVDVVDVETDQRRLRRARVGREEDVDRRVVGARVRDVVAAVVADEQSESARVELVGASDVTDPIDAPTRRLLRRNISSRVGYVTISLVCMTGVIVV